MTTPAPAPAASGGDAARDQSIQQYRKKFLEHKELEARVKKTRFDLRQLLTEYDKTEDDLKAVQNVGQIIGEVLKQLDSDRFIVKASSGPRYVVGCRSKVNKSSMVAGTRVALDMTTLTIMRTLPREVDPVVFNMLNESPGNINYSDIGGLNEQIRELREVIELPLTNPDLFKRVGIKPPKGVLLYGPPGTGKTLLARALANNIQASYLKVVASAIVDKYIGESARIIREMFGYAKEHQPCFAPDTEVLMFDHSVKRIEDIQVGEEVWGDDGQPRTVTGLIPLTQGQMYQVKQAKAVNYIVNGKHTLVVRATGVAPVIRDSDNGWRVEYKVRCDSHCHQLCHGIRGTSATFPTEAQAEAAALNIRALDSSAVVEGDVFELTVEQWMDMCSKQAQHRLQGFKVPRPVQVVHSSLPIPPYILGLYLGDGFTGKAKFCGVDAEIGDAIKEYAASVNLTFKEKNTAVSLHRKETKLHLWDLTADLGRAHPFLEALQRLGLMRLKTIPPVYLQASVQDRFELLAGLIDTAGWLQFSPAMKMEDDSQNIALGFKQSVSETVLAHHVKELAKSVGLRTTKTVIQEKKTRDFGRRDLYKYGTGSRCFHQFTMTDATIMQVPLRLPRKQPSQYNSDFKAAMATRLSVTATDEARAYCGITVNGNGRFLLADCTVVHNCVIFMDEVDAIGGRRFSQGTSADREIQRTLMELLNQLDGFDDLGRVKMVMATNRPDTLDPALLRPGRLDRKIEIPIPSESQRLDILKIHAANITKHEDIDYESVVKLCEGFNGADLRNVCITGDHRVLTRSGWMSIKEVRKGVEVLSFNIVTYSQEWKPVRAVQRIPFDPERGHRLYRMQGSGMDIVATGDHSMLIARLATGRHSKDGLQQGSPIGYQTVDELVGLKYQAKETSKVTHFAHSQVRAVVSVGINRQPAQYIVIPGLERVCQWWYEKDRQVGFLQFLGFWLGDGWLAVRFGTVKISQKKVEANEWLEGVMNEVFPHWWSLWERGEVNPGMFVYTVVCPPLYNYLRRMAIGPLGYNPCDPAQLRSYPHFTRDATLGQQEQSAGYYSVNNSMGTTSKWTEEDMLAAMSPPSSPTLSARRSSSQSARRSSEPEVIHIDMEVDEEVKELETAEEVKEMWSGDEVDPEAEVPVLDVVDKATAAAMRVAGRIVWWNNGQWIIINGNWFYLKRWLGEERQIADVYSRLSRPQAIALLDGFCRADGRWDSIQYDDSGEPTGQWSCCNSSFPLIDHLMLIGQLAGAAVDLHRERQAGSSHQYQGRAITYSADHWSLFFSFTKSTRAIPFQFSPLAQPVDVSSDEEARGYHDYKEDDHVYDITVEGNSNFLTQRLSNKRLQTKTLGVRAHSIFSGNCTEAGMFAIRVERGYVIEEDFMKAARKIAETKKLEGKLEYEKV